MPPTAEMDTHAVPVAEDDGLGPIDHDLTGTKPVEDDGTARHDYGDGLEDEKLPPKGEAPPAPPADLPADGDGDDGEEEAPKLYLLGNRELGLKVGGRKPDSSSLKVKGGKIELGGQFDRGDRFPAVFTLQVTGDQDQDSIELDSGTVKSTKKTQNATICQTSTLPDFLKSKLEGQDELLATVLRELDLEIS